MRLALMPKQTGAELSVNSMFDRALLEMLNGN